jgi:hypothetical protein
MKKNSMAAVLAIILCITTICYGTNISSSKEWAKVTQKDLAFSYQSMQRIVPYTFFQAEPQLESWLNKGYANALKQAKAASSYKAYKTTMQNYINGFKTEHLEIAFHPNNMARHAKRRKPCKVDYHKFLNNSVWITIPSFQAGGGFDNPQLEKTLKNLINILPTFRDKDLVIFDVRGNGGGSSDLARPLILSLYSKEYLLSLGTSFIWNQKWMYVDSLFPGSGEYYAGNIKYSDARKKDEKLYEKSFWPISYGQNSNVFFNKVNNPVHAQIVILADSRCGSMCYQFTRTLLGLPHAVLIGHSPDTMGRLTNPTTVSLPSRQATLYIGTREMIAPAYAFGHRLQPKYTFTGDIQNDSGVEKWVVNLYQHDKL